MKKLLSSLASRLHANCLAANCVDVCCLIASRVLARCFIASCLIANCTIAAGSVFAQMNEAPAEVVPDQTSAGPAPIIRIGSKTFTESIILGEIAARSLEAAGYVTEHHRELGGTRFVWRALLSDEIDVYPEYTGTIVQEILAGEGGTRENYAAILEEKGVGLTQPLGFNNTYALGMLEERADELDIRTISDLEDHPQLRLSFSSEFMDREDGWPGLRDTYGLPHTNVRGLEHDLAYRGLAAGSIDVTDLYSTDAEINYYDLRVLEDDRAYFPEYQGGFLYRLDLPPRARQALEALEGTISAEKMIQMNVDAKINRISEPQIAATFARTDLGIEPTQTLEAISRSSRVWQHTKEHLWLVAVSLLSAILMSIPLGIIAARYDRAGQIILGIVGVIYTIPSLALLVFMIPLLGIGGPPAMLALFLYSLLPIVRNTHAGIKNISPQLIESAEALGLKPGARLRKIELPLASRTILAGIKTSAVINIGTATLGALIGAGGYGQPILTGIRLDDMGLILEGAIPAALLALVAQGLFELAERFVVPKGLRLATS